MVRVYLRVSYGCVGLRFFLGFRVPLRLGLARVLGFSAFRGPFRLGYILGLVTVVWG